MRHEFRIGDLVELKQDQGRKEVPIYIIQDIDDEDGKDEIYYLLEQLYPVINDDGEWLAESKENFEVHEPFGTKSYRHIMEFIEKERFRHGMYDGNPDVITSKEIKHRVQNKIEELDNKMDMHVYYDKFLSHDEGLDALNDLKVLQDMFPDDEEYIAAKNKVLSRLMELNAGRG